MVLLRVFVFGHFRVPIAFVFRDGQPVIRDFFPVCCCSSSLLFPLILVVVYCMFPGYS